MKYISLSILFWIVAICASAQSWAQIKNDKQYLWGEGMGMSISEADENALSDLISKISVVVTAKTDSHDSSTATNNGVDEVSQFTKTVKTYSQATLSNTERIILHNEPDAVVGRWIKRSEVDRIFEARKRKAIDLFETAMKAEEKGKADDALRNYYWSLTLLKSLQKPNEVTYPDKEGKSRVLTNYIKERMDEVFDDVKVAFDRRSGDDVELYITYKGKPVNSLDYTFFDGQNWSNIYSAKDGRGVLELSSGNTSSQYQVKLEYEYRGEAQIDKELASVLNAVSGTLMRRAYKNITGTPASTSSAPSLTFGISNNRTESFSTTHSSVIEAPKPAAQAQAYADIMQKVVGAISTRNHQAIRSLFTDDGWTMYTKLVNYGKARVVGTPNITFYETNGEVQSRGLQMAFSFSTGLRKSFVEDMVFSFDQNKKICNLAFGLGNTAEDDILNKGVWPEDARKAIMAFLENYKTAYALKRLDYITSVFDDNAVIITAKVIKNAANTNMENSRQISSSGRDIIKYNRQTKDQYLKNLERCFANNEFINIRFANNDVQRLGQGGNVYAIQIAQDYYSSSYGDQGYLFLMVDINDPKHPSIKVRTWQPDKDPNFGLYDAGHF